MSSSDNNDTSMNTCKWPFWIWP